MSGLFADNKRSPLLFPINNGHLFHYADIIFMLTSVYGNYLTYFVMGRVCITVNLHIDQNNILYLLLLFKGIKFRGDLI